MTKVAFVTNICAHYRVKTFETLGRYYDVDYYFFSAGDEWYWQQEHGVQTGNFNYEYLPGFRLGQTRVTPALFRKLWRGNYDVYIKCINGRFVLPITYLVAKLKRKPFILWTGIWMRLETPVQRLFFRLTRYIYRHADAIVVYGEHVKRYLISEGVPPERIFVAAHAVDNQVYQQSVPEEEKSKLRHELGINFSQKVILYLGRLEKVKGLSCLLEAFAALQRDDTVLVIAGTGSEYSSLSQSVKQQGLTDRVILPGYVKPEAAIHYYSLAYVCVLPSITTAQGKESWGLVVNEAMNQGVPVIATDAVGAAAGGLIKNDVNGFVVPEQDSRALTDALEKILSQPDLHDRLSQNARRLISQWNNEQMVSGFRMAVAYVISQSSSKIQDK